MALQPDSPTPQVLANTASEALRALNHSTIDPHTSTLHDVYAVLGALGELSTRLPQATRQMSAVLSSRWITGGLRHENGDASTLEVTVQSCREQLSNAAIIAEQLATELNGAHSHVAVIAESPFGASQAPPSQSPPSAQSRGADHRASRNRGRSI